MNPSEILREAKALIGTEKTWTTGVSARNAQGKSCRVSDDAVCWCAGGAFYRVVRSRATRHNLATICALKCLKEASLQLYGRNIPDVNDHLGHEAVLAMYDRAIELAEREER